MTAKMPPLPKNRTIIHDDEDDKPIMPASAITQPASAPTDTRPPRQRRRNQGKGAYPGKRQITVYTDEDLFYKVKAISVTARKTMQELMEEALTNYVNSYAAQRKFEGANRAK
jgi:hypothetical protein